MIHPTRHHAHQPLHKNIKLTGSETKTYNQYSLDLRKKTPGHILSNKKLFSNFEMSWRPFIQVVRAQINKAKWKFWEEKSLLKKPWKNGMFRAKHKQQKHQLWLFRTRSFRKSGKQKTSEKNLHQITTKLERHTENVCERMSKDVRKHRYRLPRATLQLKLSTRMIHPTRHHTSATPQKHRVPCVSSCWGEKTHTRGLHRQPHASHYTSRPVTRKPTNKSPI